MVIGIFGESCTGKSTIAGDLKQLICAELFSGKDYMRLAKNQEEAETLFKNRLQQAVQGEHIIYVISETEHLKLLPNGAVRVLVTAELATIKERFSKRMHGQLPQPVAAMLERKHGCFDSAEHDFHVVSEQADVQQICKTIAEMIGAM